MAERRAEVERITSETTVRVALDLDARRASIATGIPFFDHMLEQVATHAPVGLDITATGDLEIDAHHTVEDVGIALGEALSRALGDKAGINRFGDALVPMEEALTQVALDISGRPLLVYEADIPAEMIGQFETNLTREFLQAFCRAGGLTLHVRLLAGHNPHHCVESVFKGLARALGRAVAPDSRQAGRVPSTKGVL